MKYRALLVDPESELGKPVQTFCNDPKQIVAWAKACLKKASAGACVEVFEYTENHVGRVELKDGEAFATAFECPKHGGEHAAFV